MRDKFHPTKKMIKKWLNEKKNRKQKKVALIVEVDDVYDIDDLYITYSIYTDELEKIESGEGFNKLKLLSDKCVKEILGETE